MVLDLARHSNRDYFEPSVLCLREAGVLARRFEEIDVAVESLDWSGRGLAKIILRLARWLRAVRPDILHTHNPSPHFVGAAAGALARVPVLVHTKHGRNHPDQPRAVAVNRIASQFTDCIVAVSHDAAEVARAVERVSNNKVCVIHNGVDLARYACLERKTGVPIRRAVHVARFTSVKDQETLLRAARIVCDAVPDFQLDLIGDGPKRADLEALQSSLGLGDRVRFSGFHDDVQRVLAESDLFVLSSVSEGLALTVLEAMAAGLPVVATEVGGNPEIVANGETGLLVPARSPVKLATAIVELIRDPDRARRLGAAGRRRVEVEFDLRRVSSRYENLYSRLLMSASGSIPAAFTAASI